MLYAIDTQLVTGGGRTNRLHHISSAEMLKLNKFISAIHICICVCAEVAAPVQEKWVWVLQLGNDEGDSKAKGYSTFIFSLFTWQRLSKMDFLFHKIYYNALNHILTLHFYLPAAQIKWHICHNSGFTYCPNETNLSRKQACAYKKTPNSLFALQPSFLARTAPFNVGPIHIDIWHQIPFSS